MAASCTCAQPAAALTNTFRFLTKYHSSTVNTNTFMKTSAIFIFFFSWPLGAFADKLLDNSALIPLKQNQVEEVRISSLHNNGKKLEKPRGLSEFLKISRLS